MQKSLPALYPSSLPPALSRVTSPGELSRPIPVTEVVVSYASHITIHVSFSRCVFWLALVVSVVTVRTNASAESHRRNADHKSAPAASSLPAIRVGNPLLTPAKGVPAYCGSLIRPFDPAGEAVFTVRSRIPSFEKICQQCTGTWPQWLDSRPGTRKQLRLCGTLSSWSAGSRSPVAIFLETRLAVSCHCSMSFA